MGYKVIKKIILSVLVFILSFTKNSSADENKTFSLITDRGNFTIKFTFMDPKVSTGSNKANLEIYDMNKNPVKSAKIEIILWMGEHGHYSSATPVIKEVKPGFYDISELDFEMKGRWEITISIKKDSIKDRVSFEILVD